VRRRKRRRRRGKRIHKFDDLERGRQQQQQ